MESRWSLRDGRKKYSEELKTLRRMSTTRITDYTGLAVNVTLFALAIAVAGYTTFFSGTDWKTQDGEREMELMVYNSVLTVGAIMWGPTFDAFIGYSNVIKQPNLMFAFFWVVAVLALELYFLPLRTFASTGVDDVNPTGGAFGINQLNSDTGLLVSVAFAMGSLLFGSKKANVLSTRFIMYGLLLCIAFIVPSMPNLSSSVSSTGARSFQHVIMNYAAGFILAGISMPLVKFFA